MTQTRRQQKSLLSRCKSLVFCTVMALLCVSSHPLHAQQVPPVHQSAILLKALAYDRQLPTRAKGSIDILLVYKQNSSELQNIKKAFDGLSTRNLKGLSIKIHTLQYTDQATLEKTIDGKQIDTLYTFEDLDTDALDTITTVTRNKDVASMTGSREHIKKGVALAVILHKNKPKLVVNLKATRAEGMDLKSTLLRVAVVIR